MDGGPIYVPVAGGTPQNFSQEVVREFHVSTVNFDLSIGLPVGHLLLYDAKGVPRIGKRYAAITRYCCQRFSSWNGLTKQVYLYRLVLVQRDRRPSEQTLSVLQALAEDPVQWRHGYYLCQQTGLKAGSIYPILIRLADRGWLDTSWETTISAGRPPRHLYRLTPAGLKWAKELEADRVRDVRRKHAHLRPRMEGSS